MKNILSPKNRSKKKDKLKKNVVHIPGCGDIPLIKKTIMRWDNTIHTVEVVDRDFKPRSYPKGTLPADLNAQNLYLTETPIFYYQDIEDVCSRCKKKYIISAREQKIWREEYKFRNMWFKNCLSCRREIRYIKELNEYLSKTQFYYNEQPNDPERMLLLAEAIVRNYLETNKGRIELAISLSRKARKINNDIQSYYWEGLALMLANFKTKALNVLLEYVDKSKCHSNLVEFSQSAKHYIKQIQDEP